MNLKPIIPPSERNYSQAEREEASAILDAETKQLLAIDRARLNQATAAGVIALSKEIGLSPEVVEELNGALINSANKLSPAYHDYVNSLLSSLVEVSNIAEPSTDVPASEQVSTDNIIEVVKLDDIPEYAGPVFEIPYENRLYTHDIKSSRFMKKFLSEVIDTEVLDVNQLSIAETSLMAWQILDYYDRYHYPKSNHERRAKQIDRNAKRIGLYEEPLSAIKIAEMEGMERQSVTYSIKKCRENISSILGSENPINMLARARKTLKVVPHDHLFVSETERVTLIRSYGHQSKDDLVTKLVNISEEADHTRHAAVG